MRRQSGRAEHRSPRAARMPVRLGIVVFMCALAAACGSSHVDSAPEPIGHSYEELGDYWGWTTVTPATGSQPWLIVLCQAAQYTVNGQAGSAPNPPETPAFYQQMFATSGAGGMYDFWTNQAAGNISMAGTVVTSSWATVSGSTANSCYGGQNCGDARYWLTSPNNKTAAVQQCINTASGVPGFGNFAHYIALWNVIVGSQGGIPITVNGQSKWAVALDVGANAEYMQHEMGHGWTLDHSFQDTFNNPCSGDGRAGAYGDTYDVMSAIGCSSNYNQSGNYLCVNAWESGASCSPWPSCEYVNDCYYTPGLNLWNLYNLGWSTSVPSQGYSGTGLYTTPAWPNSFSGSVQIAPRNRPILSYNRGIFVQAHKEYGYIVELEAPALYDLGLPTALTIRRVFYNNALSFLVTESGGTQTTPNATPFVESNAANSEGSVTITLTGLSGNPPIATVSVSYAAGTAGIWWNQDFGYPLVNDANNFPSNHGDWAPGWYKGQCWPGQPIIGVSKAVSGDQQFHGMQCGPRTLGLNTAQTFGAGTSGGVPETRVLQSQDNRCTTDGNWDWDPGNYKLECCANEVVAGVSQGSNGTLASVLCEAAAASDGSAFPSRSSSNCTVEVFYNNNSQDFSGYDWDPGYYKGQCPAGYYTAGISTPAFGPNKVGSGHALLCCAP